MTELLDGFFNSYTTIENEEIKILLKKFLIGEIDDDCFRSEFLAICETVAENKENIVDED
ncbi:hypothetical protein GC096_25990 [Paenibacillus sp. LMG 31461]|uniref:Uncharacterized protein n=1 Tax=Paenibacillus plantarum TaxID=2654975 RepID=A0ABX1XGD9_9BACL|nr:hypothetical protein [Paenibacillus plantarum]NOU67499.1 hypothetical protein [Paenibacillus plantarum]